ncbi:hypothetical protein BDR26DRAFT_848997 [Obelidium mucronatum]|nr:hypothetical protein BDR26DRAFT_848997 [Obelidium mucronatum]
MTLTEERLANSWNRTCIFCNEKSPDFTDENLDIHYWRDCPMLCSCPLCHLIVEIPVLTAHMHDECDNKKLVKQCSRCKECIMTAEFQSHVERQTCLPASIIPGVARCPLCHMDVPHGESGWKTHLLQNGCSRKKKDSDIGSETNLDVAHVENKSNSDETTTAVLKAAEPKISKGKKKEDGISETNLNLAPSENVNQTTPAVLKPANGLKKPKSVIKSATK